MNIIQFPGVPKNKPEGISQEKLIEILTSLSDKDAQEALLRFKEKYHGQNFTEIEKYFLDLRQSELQKKSTPDTSRLADTILDLIKGRFE